MNCRFIAFAVGIASLCLNAQAENWPQWRGPAFNGSSPEKNLPVSWSSSSNLVWSAPLPRFAGSTPVVWNDYVFVTTPDNDKNLFLYCFNTKNGSLRWKNQVSTGDREASGAKNNMASPSPVTDGKKVIVLFGTADMAAFDMDGKPLWERSLSKDYGKPANMWIYGSSPLLLDGKLYVQMIQRDEPAGYPHAMDDKPKRDSFILCMDPNTGTNLWRHIRLSDAVKETREAYTTPIPRQGANGWELLVVGSDYVTCHNASDGAELWRSMGLNPRQTAFQRDWYRVVPSALVAGNVIVACGPKKQPVFAIKPGGKGDVTASHRAWIQDKLTSDWSTPLYYKNKLFIMDGEKKILSCVKPQTGAVQWSGPLGTPDIIWSSPTGADDKIYCMSERGTVVVLSAGNEFSILAKNTFGDEGPGRSSVAVANGHLFIRTAKALYCVGNTGAK